MNFAEHLLFGTTRSPEEIIFHACSEGGANLRHVSWVELWASVEKMADAMISAGVRTGDRVAAIISNRPETITCCLAALSIGAIWSTSSPDMGTKGILDRMMQIRPKIVFAESSVVYNGKRRDLMAKHREWTQQMASTPDFLSTVLIVESADVQTDLGNDFVTWDAFVKRGVTGRKLQFQQLPFHHPGFIVFSSGTVGGIRTLLPSRCVDRFRRQDHPSVSSTPQV
jgi:acetoacetyl-CoA synthetase